MRLELGALLWFEQLFVLLLDWEIQLAVSSCKK